MLPPAWETRSAILNDLDPATGQMSQGLHDLAHVRGVVRDIFAAGDAPARVSTFNSRARAMATAPSFTS
jgi:hypothetical protein